MKLLSLMLIPMIALAVPAFAQSTPEPSSDQAYDAGPVPDAQSAPPPRHAPAVRFRTADSNGDGRLSRAEAQAIPFVTKHFDAIDTDHDGFVTHAEMRAVHQRMQAARAQRAGVSSGS